MKTDLKLDQKMHIIADDGHGHETHFDTIEKKGGDNSAATPMMVMLESLGACSFMDVISILRKKRKSVDGFEIHIEAERAKEHPQVFTEVHLVYELTSSDAEEKDLDRSIELSQDKYCGVSAMFRNSGCKVTWESKLNRP